MSEATITPTRRPATRPQSPVAADRLEEKRELNDLNSRLERYISAVRDLNEEKRDLQARLAEASGTFNPSAKKAYEDKIAQLRQELEDLQKEKSFLRLQVTKKESDVRGAEEKVRKVLRQLEDAERRSIALEQKIPDLEEQLKFLNQIHDDEVKTLRTKIADRDNEIDRLKNHLKDEMAKALDKERGEWDQKAHNEKEAIITHHRDAIERLEAELTMTTIDNANLKVDASTLKADIKNLNDTLADLRRESQMLRDDLHQLQDKTNSTITRLQSQISEKHNELTRIKQDAQLKVQEYTELAHVNISLNQEIQAYRRLLSGEESRLGLRRADESPAKKRRIEEEPVAAPAPASSSSPRQAPAVTDSPVAAIPQPVRTPRIQEQLSENGAGEASPKVTPLKTIPKKTGIANIEELNLKDSIIKVANLTQVIISLFLLLFFSLHYFSLFNSFSLVV